MSWNYRVFKEEVTLKGKLYITYDMREVYYDKNGNVNGWTEPIIKGFESLDDMEETLRFMINDVKRNPILKEKDLLDKSGK